MLEQILEESKQKQTLLAIHLYGESTFWCGIIDDFNYEFFQLRHFNKNGDFDGILIERMSKIERLDIQDEYLESLKIIIAKNQEIRNTNLKTRIFEELDEENWQFVCLKPYEGDKNVVVGIEVNNESFYRGFVIQMDDNFIQFEILKSSGDAFGISLFKVGDINSVKINDLEGRRMLALYQERFKKFN